MDEEFAAKRQRVLSLLERADMPDDIKERYIRLTMHYSEWSELKEVLVGDLDLRGDLVEPRMHRLVLGDLMRQIEAIE